MRLVSVLALLALLCACAAKAPAPPRPVAAPQPLEVLFPAAGLRLSYDPTLVRRADGPPTSAPFVLTAKSGPLEDEADAAKLAQGRFGSTPSVAVPGTLSVRHLPSGLNAKLFLAVRPDPCSPVLARAAIVYSAHSQLFLLLTAPLNETAAANPQFFSRDLPDCPSRLAWAEGNTKVPRTLHEAAQNGTLKDPADKWYPAFDAILNSIAPTSNPTE